MSALERLGPWRTPLAWAAFILVATSVPLPSGSWAATELPLDKAAHVLLYLGLGWCSARALRASGKTGPLATAAALVAGAAFAALDEAHQAWLVSRTASLADWVADVAGMAIGFLLVAIAARRSRRDGEREPERP